MTVKSQAELASRIERASPVDAEGRYDMASKVEVKAYFKVEIARLHDINTANTLAVARLEAQVAELEMSRWAKFKRWLAADLSRTRERWRGGDNMIQGTPEPEDPRIVGKPPEFAAPYGEKKLSVAEATAGIPPRGVEIKQGDSPTVDLGPHTKQIEAAMEKKARVMEAAAKHLKGAHNA